MTRRQIENQINRVLSASHRLNGELSVLGNMASEVFGAEYIADLCNGGEIEFRPIMEDGVADDGCSPDNHLTRYAEEIYSILERR